MPAKDHASKRGTSGDGSRRQVVNCGYPTKALVGRIGPNDTVDYDCLLNKYGLWLKSSLRCFLLYECSKLFRSTTNNGISYGTFVA